MPQRDPASRDRSQGPAGRDVDLKLRLIMRTLGAATQKEMLALLKQVNPATGFNLDRAYKWIAGRAAPRDLSIYDDLAQLLDLTLDGVPVRGTQLGSLPFEDFYLAMRERYGDRVSLDMAPGALADAVVWSAESGTGFGIGGPALPIPGHVLGSYLAISPAWSVHRRGDLVLGLVTIGRRAAPTVGIDYREKLPGGDLVMQGTMRRSGRCLYAVVTDPESEDMITMVFATPSVPGVLLAGMMTGVPAHDADLLPVAGRIVCIDLATLRNGTSQSADDGLPAFEPYCAATPVGVRQVLEAAGADRDLAAWLAEPVCGQLLDPCGGGVLALDKAALNAITGRLLA